MIGILVLEVQSGVSRGLLKEIVALPDGRLEIVVSEDLTPRSHTPRLVVTLLRLRVLRSVGVRIMQGFSGSKAGNLLATDRAVRSDMIV